MTATNDDKRVLAALTKLQTTLAGQPFHANEIPVLRKCLQEAADDVKKSGKTADYFMFAFHRRFKAAEGEPGGLPSPSGLVFTLLRFVFREDPRGPPDAPAPPGPAPGSPGAGAVPCVEDDTWRRLYLHLLDVLDTLDWAAFETLDAAAAGTEKLEDFTERIKNQKPLTTNAALVKLQQWPPKEPAAAPDAAEEAPASPLASPSPSPSASQSPSTPQ